MNDQYRELRYLPGVYVDEFGFLFRLNSEGGRDKVPDGEVNEIVRAFNDPTWEPKKEVAMACDKDCDCGGKAAPAVGNPQDAGIADQVNAYYVKIGSGVAEGMPQTLTDKLTIDYQQHLFRNTEY